MKKTILLALFGLTLSFVSVMALPKAQDKDHAVFRSEGPAVSYDVIIAQKIEVATVDVFDSKELKDYSYATNETTIVATETENFVRPVYNWERKRKSKISGAFRINHLSTIRKLSCSSSTC